MSRKISFYTDMSEPNQELVRANLRMSPEERWKAFLKMRRLYVGLMGPFPKEPKGITITRPSWM